LAQALVKTEFQTLFPAMLGSIVFNLALSSSRFEVCFHSLLQQKQGPSNQHEQDTSFHLPSQQTINVATISAGFEKGDVLVRARKDERAYFDFFEETFNFLSTK